MSLPYTVKVPNEQGSSFDVRVRVDLNDGKNGKPAIDQQQAMAFLKSMDFRKNFQSGWAAKSHPGYGSDMSGRPEAIYRTYDAVGQPDRASGVIAYEFVVRMTQPL